MPGHKDYPVIIISESQSLLHEIIPLLSMFQSIQCLTYDEIKKTYIDHVLIFDMIGKPDNLELKQFVDSNVLIGIINTDGAKEFLKHIDMGFDELIFACEIRSCFVPRLLKAIGEYERRNSFISRINTLEKFNDILIGINKKLDLETLLDNSIDAVKGLLGVEKASILLFEDEELIVKACEGLPSKIKRGYKTLKKDSISYITAQSKKIILVNDINHEEKYKLIRSGTNYKKSSFISAPIMFYNNIIGVLNLNDKICGDFNQDDADIVEVFTSHLAISIVNAHLFLDLKDKAAKLLYVNREKEKLNKKISSFNVELTEIVNSEKEKLKNAYQELIKRDNELQRKILELISLKKAGKAAISELFNIELVLDVILNIALNEVDALRGSIVLKDKDGQFIVKAAAGEAKEIVNAIVGNDDNITQYVLKKGKPLLISNIEKHPVLKKTNLNSKYTTKSLLSLPLKAGSEVYGVMNVNNKHNNKPFTNDDLDILNAFADHASMAIRNFYLSRELRDKEFSLQQAEKMAEIGNLVVAVAHEIRNPLGILRTNIEYLSEIFESNQEIFDNMIAQINRARKFIKELMHYGKPAVLNKVKSKMADILEVSLNHSLSAGRKIPGLGIIKDYPDHEIVLNIDPIKLQQVFINIITNALDEVRDIEGPMVRIGLWVDNDQAYMSVEDNGGGIREDVRENIFKPFFSLKKGEKGTGLGLPIAKKIIEMHNGKLYHDDGFNDGARFIVILPCWQ